MISAWWLLLIVPCTFSAGYVAGAVVMLLKAVDEIEAQRYLRKNSP